MKRVKSLTVKAKLIGGFLVVAAVAALIGAVGLFALGRVDNLAIQMYEREIVGLRYAADTRGQVIGAGGAVRAVMLAKTEAESQAGIELLKRRFANAYANLEPLDGLFVTDTGKAAVRQARASIQEFERAALQAVALDRDTSSAQAAQQVQKALDLMARVETEMHQLVDRKQQNAKALDEEITQLYRDMRVLSLSLTAAGVLLAIALGWLLTRGLTRQLGGEPADVARIATAIAKGDLTNEIDQSQAVDGSIVQAIARMQSSLREVVAAVRSGSINIAGGSSQIAAGSTDLSQRTEEQAANLTETASAMEELAGTVKSNSDVAQQAAQMAQSASGAAHRGGSVVSDVVHTMEDINAASRRIVDIIGVIDSIAFQTNILALNAAVEAARAGEQGRGFAVVASEVRTLAQKSAAAAKDIKSLIDDSVAKVEAGSQMVDAAGEAMREIVQQVQRVTDLISEISAATREQTTGIAQVNEAVLQLSDVTQQNAALVEESASASGSLNEQAGALVEVVSVFRLGQEHELQRSAQGVAAASARPQDARSSGRAIHAQTAARAPAAQSAAGLKPVPPKRSLTMGKQEPVREEEWEEF
ncbi:methyl-accepting chemotaxis protein [Parapusillimonas granuli]|uniref:MCP four helix bundle domain-containing protein n=1 Tax=Parapusillimonas granuli TaxID=380911 RepID=A0A853G3C8_9BURK|nr:methyl-accepting chemotaxis protein [Parapusillimonas granuli]MBB5213363.1 methyl-accepting chemotaxis protein [Parapusillimonas granuli]NYT51858.1 MCP four helix bundle domain-containing protein [Parapusillimonas granuli]